MAIIGSKLITKQMEYLSNMTEANHLGKALMTKPHVFEGVMNQMFTSKMYANNPLSSMLMGKNEVTVPGTEWEWKLKGASRKPLVVLETVTGTPGLGNTTFTLKLNEPWFKYGDVITPGSDDKKYQCRVAKDPVRSGDGYNYSLEIMTKDQMLSVPAKYTVAGSQWFKLYSQYGEGSKRGGSVQFSTDIALKGGLSLFRKEYAVTDYASNAVLATKILGSDGKIYDTWIKYAEVEFWKQWYEELDAAFWFSRSTDTVYDETGRPVQAGPGLQEQLEDSHVATYSTLTAKLIQEYLMDIFYGRIAPGKGRNITAFTGEYGMVIFHEAVQDWMNKSGFIKSVDVTNSAVMNKTTSPYHSNALEVGYQIVKYNMANGTSLTLIHNPLYDSRLYNSEIDPVTGYPVSSMRFTFLDFDNGQGGSNIKLVNKDKGYAFWYVAGGVGPYGPANGDLRANGNMSYEMHAVKSCGAWIGDVTRCGELKLVRG